jgi:hypothetical protein
MKYLMFIIELLIYVQRKKSLNFGARSRVEDDFGAVWIDLGGLVWRGSETIEAGN